MVSLAGGTLKVVVIGTSPARPLGISPPGLAGGKRGPAGADLAAQARGSPSGMSVEWLGELKAQAREKGEYVGKSRGLLPHPPPCATAMETLGYRSRLVKSGLMSDSTQLRCT